MRLPLLFLFTVTCAVFTSPLHAAECTNPFATTGTMIYNTAYSVVQVCNSAGRWIALGGNGNDGSAEVDPKIGAMIAGKWCTSTGTQITCTTDSPVFTGGLTDLTDTSINNPVTGNVLTYNGTEWVNMAPSGSGLEDRLISGTLSVVANTTGYISLTTAGTTWGYFGTTGNYLPNLNLGSQLNIATTESSATLTVSGTTFTNALRLRQTAGNAPSSYQGSHWLTSGTNIFYNSGNVGIGTNNPEANLHIRGQIRMGDSEANASSRIFMQEDLDSLFGFSIVYNGDNTNTLHGVPSNYFGMVGHSNSAVGNPAIIIPRTGSAVGIGTAPSYKLHVAGQVAGNAAYVNTSDARLKTNIQPLPYGLETLAKLRPITFHWKEQAEDWQHGRKLGLIAQEVERIIPEAVSTATDPSNTKSIAYSDLIPVLIHSIQQLEARVKELEAHNNTRN